MMYVWRGDRKGLPDLLAGTRNLNEVEPVSSAHFPEQGPSSSSLIAVWQNDPRQNGGIPNAILVNERAIAELFAWTQTYYRKVRPITAYCRVLTTELAEVAAMGSGGIRHKQFHYGALGLTIAEAMAYSIGLARTDQLSFAALTRTLSFPLTQVLFKYDQGFWAGSRIVGHLASRWDAARAYFDQRPLVPSTERIAEVWSRFLSAFAVSSDWKSESGDPVQRALAAYRGGSERSRDVFEVIRAHIGIPSGIESVMVGPIERRVQMCLEITRGLTTHRSESSLSMRAFCAGFIASRIQPGNFDFLDILTPILAELPESFLWFGLFAGLDSGEALEGYGSGIGALLVREISRPEHWLDRPFADIAFEELATMGNSTLSVRELLKPMQGSAALVEIFPMVYGSIRVRERGEEQRSRLEVKQIEQQSIFSEKSDSMNYKDLIQAIDESQASIETLRKRVEQAFGQVSTRSKRRQKTDRG